MTWQGAEDLRELITPVGAIKADALNARQHPARSLDAVRESFRRFGQVRPLLVHTFKGDKRPTVIAGNAGLAAAVALGWTHVAIVAFKGTDEEARAYAIADNRIAELSEWGQGLADSIGAASLMKGWDELAASMYLDALLPSDSPAATVEPQLRGMRYSIVIDCDDEAQQVALLERFATEGLKCRALIL